MDYTVASWRVRKEIDFVAKYGEVETPRHDEAWRMIDSGVGAAEQHKKCTQGKHDFDWCDEIFEHTCFFCLHIEGSSSDNDDPEAPPLLAAMEKGDNAKVSKRKRHSSSDEDGSEKSKRFRSSELHVVAGVEGAEAKDCAADEALKVGEHCSGGVDEGVKVGLQAGEAVGDDADYEDDDDDAAEEGDDSAQGVSDDDDVGDMLTGLEKADVDSDGKSFSESDDE